MAVGLCMGTIAWAENVDATLVHTAGAQWGSNKGASTVDAVKEHYNNNASSGWAGCAYAKFSFAIPEGKSITSAVLTYSVSQGGSYGRDDIIYYMAKDFDIDWANFAGQTGTDLRNTSSRGGTAVASAPTGGTGDRLNLSQDIKTAVKAIYEAGQNYIILQWTGNAGGADLYGLTSEHSPTLSITYSNETLYTATFTETNSLEPTVTIYSDASRTSAVDNGTLTDKTTYYYRAVLAGYNNYEGTFTVNGANPSESFTMTAKTRYTFKVNAVNSVGGAVLETFYTDEDSYEGKTHNIVYPKYLTGANNVVTYSKDNNTYGESKTAQAKDETYTVSYTAYDGVAYFVEVEDVVSATAYSSWNCSNGGAVRGFTTAKDIFTVPATGVYDVTYAACNNNVNNDLSVTLSKNETEIATKTGLKSVSVNFIKTTGIVTKKNIPLAKDDVLKLTPSTSNGIVDYMLVELKTAESVTVSTAGFATYVSSYDLDFSATDIEAYKVKVNTKGVATLTKVDEVPAGTPVLLYYAGGKTEDIPVMADAAAVTENDLLAGTGAAVATTDGDYTNMILNNVESKIGFYFANGQTVAANRAYLHIATTLAPTAEARMSIVFDDEVTGIENLTPTLSEGEGAFYDLQGRRVAQPTKGLYIMNGKKVMIK